MYSLASSRHSRITHPWICNHPWCLHKDNLLDKFDTARADSCRGSIPSLDYIRLYRRHFIPRWRIMRVCDASGTCNIRHRSNNFTNYTAIHRPFIGKSTVGGWHVHIAKYKTIDTCRSLYHTLYHPVIFTWHLQKLLECLQHDDAETLLLLQRNHGACKSF